MILDSALISLPTRIGKKSGNSELTMTRVRQSFAPSFLEYLMPKKSDLVTQLNFR